MRVLYHPSKTNIMMDAPSKLSIGSVSYMEKGKK
ncbi:hypothetical protein MTR67_018263 [Solanum verrucosum]|uniref:Uncharacterized protein n=1 Tax=Solanum verrucosum TaxID=315347 RepID=A0AAF0TTJ6_SOLVR|nr:hypothetical protein MTR67_018263 [Solanum verrucosum]